MRLATMAVCLLVMSTVSGCLWDEWEGFIYPNKHDLTRHVNIGKFKSLEACRAAAMNALRAMNSLGSGDYECGLNCKANTDLGGIKVCEKTER